ncbi:MAG TPA: hypothetical protein VHO72_07910 [Bacteroidales bacterium]|nr:hypothetical protein [Bacteroidales bacterium]
MTFVDWTGFVGVAILLVAFFLNLKEVIKSDSMLYLTLNIVGSGIACCASVLLKYIPFIILEGSWMLVSLFGLIQYFRKQ